MYWYVLVYTDACTKLEQHTSFDHAPSALRRLRVSADLLAFFWRTVFFLMAVSSMVRPPRRGLPRPNFHSHWLSSYTLLPRLPSAAAESAQPTGKPEPLNLLNYGIVGVELQATYFVRWVLKLGPARWTQVAGEEELGACIPHVFPWNISFIFHYTVRIGRDH
jgi:hypothetical protein